jgi:hypothetical protein
MAQGTGSCQRLRSLSDLRTLEQASGREIISCRRRRTSRDMPSASSLDYLSDRRVSNRTTRIELIVSFVDELSCSHNKPRNSGTILYFVLMPPHPRLFSRSAYRNPFYVVAFGEASKTELPDLACCESEAVLKRSRRRLFNQLVETTKGLRTFRRTAKRIRYFGELRQETIADQSGDEDNETDLRTSFVFRWMHGLKPHGDDEEASLLTQTRFAMNEKNESRNGVMHHDKYLNLTGREEEELQPVGSGDYMV